MTDKKIKVHYAELLEEYGDSVEAAQYSSRETQERRFEILAEVAPLGGCKVLDFGSGTGHLATYLESKGIQVNYTGVDIVEEFFPYGREKHPQHRFGLLDEFSNEVFDFAFVSGVFNNRMDNNQQFYQDTLIDLFKRVDKGMAFNMMSKYVDYEDKNLFYVYPEQVFKFVKREITPYVCLRNDYQVKPGVIPFEFAIYAYKN